MLQRTTAHRGVVNGAGDTIGQVSHVAVYQTRHSPRVTILFTMVRQKPAKTR